jgi:UDP-glucuronate 4-epimerase
MAAVMTDPVLVTGAAGFIGFHLTRRLLASGRNVVGVDSMSPYYDAHLKEARLAELQKSNRFCFEKLDLAERDSTAALFAEHKFPYVVHLAAQAGVRYSLVNPYVYADANLQGFTNVLEGCRQEGCKHLVFASSSSVYGANTKVPFSTSDNVDHPISFYAASKKANELMAHSYAHLFGIPCTGLRFFTVYGPWGRPDMAIWIFTQSIIEGKPIKLFNYGNMRRDFTYVDDIVEAVVRLVNKPAIPDPSWSGGSPNPSRSKAPWQLYNIGNNKPVELRDLVRLLEEVIGKKANCEMFPIQPGDVPETYANVDDLMRDVGFRPGTSIEEGLKNFVAWYRNFYNA